MCSRVNMLAPICDLASTWLWVLRSHTVVGLPQRRTTSSWKLPSLPGYQLPYRLAQVQGEGSQTPPFNGEKCQRTCRHALEPFKPHAAAFWVCCRPAVGDEMLGGAFLGKPPPPQYPVCSRGQFFPRGVLQKGNAGAASLPGMAHDTMTPSLFRGSLAHWEVIRKPDDRVR